MWSGCAGDALNLLEMSNNNNNNNKVLSPRRCPPMGVRVQNYTEVPPPRSIFLLPRRAWCSTGPCPPFLGYCILTCATCRPAEMSNAVHAGTCDKSITVVLHSHDNEEAGAHFACTATWCISVALLA